MQHQLMAISMDYNRSRLGRVRTQWTDIIYASPISPQRGRDSHDQS
jgi:hypothetical protein